VGSSVDNGKAWPGQPAGNRSPVGAAAALPDGLSLKRRVEALRVLIVDDNVYIRRVVRGMLQHLGVRAVHEAADGVSGLEAIRALNPDVVLLDWEMPLLNGAEFMRIVRSPDLFPFPDVSIVMLTSHGERWRVVESARLGVNEFLVKPVSPQRLLEKLHALVARPRPFVQTSAYYGPEPRRPTGELPEAASPDR